VKNLGKRFKCQIAVIAAAKSSKKIKKQTKANDDEATQTTMSLGNGGWKRDNKGREREKERNTSAAAMDG